MDFFLAHCSRVLRDGVTSLGRTQVVPIVALGLCLLSACRANATTFVVDTTEFITETGECSASAGDCSLYDAISASNAHGGTASDTIAFQIPKSDSGYNASTGVFTIDGFVGLTSMTRGSVIMDGATQTAFTGNTNANGPEIEVNAGGYSCITIDSDKNTIKNLIVTGAGTQILVTGDSNTIESCYLGMNPKGTGPSGDGAAEGISLRSCTNTVIGGNTAAKGNIIGNASEGISLFECANSIIQHNTLKNVFSGMSLESCTNTSISFNTISGGGGNGITLDWGGSGNSIRQNSIYDTDGLGIDLDDDGVTANDTGDEDGGSNLSQNFPSITGVTASGGNTTVQMSLNSAANATYTLDVYRLEASDIPTTGDYDPVSGFGSGRTWVGQTSLRTDASGNGSKSLVVAGGAANSFYCATATSGDNNTSEFSFVRQTGGGSGSVVTNTNDSGLGSLRNAISFVQLSGEATAITFNIPKTDTGYNSASGVFTIKLLDYLPYISMDNLTIDGVTQTAFGGNTNPSGPEVEITSGAGIYYGLYLYGDGDIVRGLMVNGFATQITFGGDSNTIEGCHIGVDHTGTKAASNNGRYVAYNIGINVYTQSKTVIGGSTAAMGNIIGYGANGINLESCADTTIQNNEIYGQSKNGISINSCYTGALLLNEIHGVKGTGINIFGDSHRFTVRQNSIYDNTGPGIDLGNDGVTINDTGDDDAGPNNFQNFPIITQVTTSGGNTTVEFSLNAVPYTTYTIDVYRTPTNKVLSNGYGPGMTWVGQTSLTTNNVGNASSSMDVSGVVANSSYVATATSNGNNTSEFSLARASGTVSGVPKVGVATPKTGSDGVGVARTITMTYSDSDGANDISTARLLVSSNVEIQSAALYGYYDRVANKLYLYNDAGTALLGGFAPGSANVISNSQGSLNCQNTTVSSSGNTLTVKWSFDPSTTFTGVKGLYGMVVDKSGLVDGLVQIGAWTVLDTPTNGKVTPASGSSRAGTQRILSATYNHTDGISGLGVVRLLVNSTLATNNGLYGYYDVVANKLYLQNDAGTAMLGGFAPGSAKVISNSQGSLNCQNTTVSSSGNTLTVKWAFTPKATFKGAKNLYLRATGRADNQTIWEDKGTWTITVPAGSPAPSQSSSFDPSANNS